jgi:hypothetical protein
MAFALAYLLVDALNKIILLLKIVPVSYSISRVVRRFTRFALVGTVVACGNNIIIPLMTGSICFKFCVVCIWIQTTVVVSFE